MKRAFTLIEMLVVIAILVALMMLVFRIGSIAAASDERMTTIMRLQCLENCLSGFHAAFGSYPPVRVYGNRDFHQQKDEEGLDISVSWDGDADNWKAIDQVCKSQPVAARFPPLAGSDMNGIVADWMAMLGEVWMEPEAHFDEYDKFRSKTGGDSASDSSSAAFNLLESKNQRGNFIWGDDADGIMVFQFGLMSYLLPRYTMMMGGFQGFYAGMSGGYAQWNKNNDLPACPYCGYIGNDCTCGLGGMTWQRLQQIVASLHDSDNNNGIANNEDFSRLKAIPSMAVCARWLPNLEGICEVLMPLDPKLYSNPKKLQQQMFYGIAPFPEDTPVQGAEGLLVPEVRKRLTVNIFGANGGNRDQYVLDCVTVRDGWNRADAGEAPREFYYYSRPPYQSYILWSAGPDGKTYPPWISRDKIKNKKELQIANQWTADDIIQMRN